MQNPALLQTWQKAKLLEPCMAKLLLLLNGIMQTHAVATTSMQARMQGQLSMHLAPVYKTRSRQPVRVVSILVVQS
jgi:hypothetical protein